MVTFGWRADKCAAQLEDGKVMRAIVIALWVQWNGGAVARPEWLPNPRQGAVLV